MKLLPFALLAVCASCTSVPRPIQPDPMQKVELDLARLDADGLRGPPDGKVSVSYEFCIPKQSWFSPKGGRL